jgi:hypothetical protein
LALFDFPHFWHNPHIVAYVSIWILEAANLLSLPIFIGFSLIGLFSWPVGGVEQSRYYPLLALVRDMDTLKTDHDGGGS